MISWEEFNKIDLRAETIVKSELFEGVRKPALKLWIDFGSNWGIKKSSARITKHYSSENVIGKQVICVTNFSPKQIGNFISEVLVTGFEDEQGNVVLSTTNTSVPNGAKLF
jgi:tRNA-binding protein